ncbi:hypothetical protein UT300012_24670 [Paraclostridium bifermentans]
MYAKNGTLQIKNEQLKERAKVTGCLDYQIKLVRDAVKELVGEGEDAKEKTVDYNYRLQLRTSMLTDILYTKGVKLGYELLEEYFLMETSMPKNVLLNYGGTDIRLHPEVESKLISELEDYTLSKINSLGDVEIELDERTAEEKKADKEAGKAEPTFGKNRIGKFPSMEALASNDRFRIEYQISEDEILLEDPAKIEKREEINRQRRLVRANFVNKK